MNKTFIASALLTCVLTVPAFAGGANCASHSASVAGKGESCVGKSTTTAWSGVWLQRTSSGQVMVAEVAQGSPAAKAGLKSGDIVLAVNGYNLSNSKESAMCASSAECRVGRTVAYTVKRGWSKKSVTLKLESMPNDATARYASRKAAFDPALAAVVISSAN